MRPLARKAAFAWVAYAFLVTMASSTLPSPLYPIYQHQLGFGELTITVIFATYAVGVIAGLILTGRLSDSVGRRPVLLFGLACGALSAVLFLVAHSLPPVLVGRILSGLSVGAFAGAATAALLDLAPDGRRDMAALVAVAVNLGGLGCGTLLSGAIADFGDAPLRVPYWASLVLLLPAAVGVVLTRETVKTPSRLSLAPQRLSVPKEARGTFVRASLGGYSGFAVSGLFGSVAPVFLARFLGLPSPLLAGGLITLLFAASAGGQLAVGRMPEHVSLVGGSVALVAAALLTLSAVEAESLALLIAASVAGGIGQGLTVGGGVLAVSAATPPECRGEVLASLFVVLYTALAVPIVGIGLVDQAVGLRPAAVIFSALMAALALAGAVSVALRERPEESLVQ